MKKGDRFANQFNKGGNRATPEEVIRSSEWQEHRVSSSSQNWNQSGSSGRPSLHSESYNWEHSASGSSSWKDPPDRAHLTSGGTGAVDYNDYSDDSVWQSGKGCGTGAYTPWHDDGVPDDPWSNL